LTSATYDDANQIATFGGTSYTYDDNGNLTSDGTRAYTWNARDQLASLTGPVNGSFAYDAVGRRRSKTIGGTTTQFLYDGLNPVQELASGTPTANLLTGLGLDEFFTRTDGAGVRNYLTDALGSSVALLDGSGTVQTEYTYEPFGATSVTGGATTSAHAFTGRENDETGLYYYRARYYHPTAQRFVSEDPLDFAAGDANLYAYVGNDATNITDPTGEIAPWAAACLLGAAGATATDFWSGRKFSWKNAGAGCGMGLLGLGFAKAAGAGARAAAGWGGRGARSGANSGARGAGRGASSATREATRGGSRPPRKGPPNGHEKGPRRDRDYDSNGDPLRDYDKPHPGQMEDHIHEWRDGVREHPGRPYSPYPRR
jgi:RHS repeat-associated protein